MGIAFVHVAFVPGQFHPHFLGHSPSRPLSLRLDNAGNNGAFALSDLMGSLVMYSATSGCKGYALDATTIDLCLSLFPWATFRQHKAAIKLHTLLTLQGNFPTVIIVSTGSVHDVNILDQLVWEAGAFYIMDPAPVSGSFHAKVWIVVGDCEFLLLTGSGNLTQAGFIDNAELFDALHIKADAPPSWDLGW